MNRLKPSFQSKHQSKANMEPFKTILSLKKNDAKPRQFEYFEQLLMPFQSQKTLPLPAEVDAATSTQCPSHCNIYAIAAVLTERGYFEDDTQTFKKLSSTRLQCRIVSGPLKDLIIDCRFDSKAIIFAMHTPQLSLFCALKSLKKKIEHQLSHQFSYDVAIEIAHVE